MGSPPGGVPRRGKRGPLDDAFRSRDGLPMLWCGVAPAAAAVRRGTPPGGDPMLEAQGEPERSSACRRANPGRKERRGDSTEWDNATPPLSGGQSLSPCAACRAGRPARCARAPEGDEALGEVVRAKGRHTWPASRDALPPLGPRDRPCARSCAMGVCRPSASLVAVDHQRWGRAPPAAPRASPGCQRRSAESRSITAGAERDERALLPLGEHVPDAKAATLAGGSSKRMALLEVAPPRWSAARATASILAQRRTGRAGLERGKRRAHRLDQRHAREELGVRHRHRERQDRAPRVADEVNRHRGSAARAGASAATPSASSATTLSGGAHPVRFASSRGSAASRRHRG